MPAPFEGDERYGSVRDERRISADRRRIAFDALRAGLAADPALSHLSARELDAAARRILRNLADRGLAV